MRNELFCICKHTIPQMYSDWLCHKKIILYIYITYLVFLCRSFPLIEYCWLGTELISNGTRIKVRTIDFTLLSVYAIVLSAQLLQLYSIFVHLSNLFVLLINGPLFSDAACFLLNKLITTELEERLALTRGVTDMPYIYYYDRALNQLIYMRHTSFFLINFLRENTVYVISKVSVKKTAFFYPANVHFPLYFLFVYIIFIFIFIYPFIFPKFHFHYISFYTVCIVVVTRCRGKISHQYLADRLVVGKAIRGRLLMQRHSHGYVNSTAGLRVGNLPVTSLAGRGDSLWFSCYFLWKFLTTVIDIMTDFAFSYSS